MNDASRLLPSDSPGTPDRWFMLAYVGMNYFVLYTHRNLVNYIQPALMKTVADGGLGLTDAELGWLGPAWSVPYCAAQLFVGYLSDRYRRRTVILSSLMASVLALAAMGLVRDINELLVGRVLLGLAQACAVPAMASVIADCFTPRTRSKAVALYLFSYNCALIAAGKFGGEIADVESFQVPLGSTTWVVTGWRMAHFAFAGVGLVGWLILLVLLKEPSRTERSEQEGLGTATPSVWATLGAVFRVPTFLLMCLVFACNGILGRVQQFWLPQHFYNIFNKSIGWRLEDTGFFATVWFQTGTMGGLFLGGLLADRLASRWFRGRLVIQLIGWLAMAPTWLLLGTQESAAILAIGMFVYGLGLGFFQANLWTATFEVIDPAARATAVGLLNLTSGLLVLSWFDPVIGMLESSAKAAGGSLLDTMITSAAGVSGFALLLTLLIVSITLPRDYIGERPGAARTGDTQGQPERP